MHGTEGRRLDPVPPPRWRGRAPDGIAVVVVDDEKALAEALAAALPVHDSVRRAVAASDPSEAASALQDDVDVVVVGMDSRKWDALGFLHWAARRRPEIALVAMSGTEDVELVTAALKAGAVSWLPTWVAVEDMAEVVAGASRGESSVPPLILRHVLRRLTADSSSPRGSVFLGLTERERDVLELAVMGYSRNDVAGELGLSVNTVRTHLQHILRKLGVHTTLEAVTLVLRERAASR